MTGQKARTSKAKRHASETLGTNELDAIVGAAADVFDSTASSLPRERQKAIFRDIETECVALVAKKRNDYESDLAKYGGGGGLLGNSGLLGGGGKRPDGSYVVPPWENTPLKAFALDLGIAISLSLKHSTPPQDVLEIGARNLSNAHGNGMWRLGASDFLIRWGISNLASALQHGAKSLDAQTALEREHAKQQNATKARQDHMRTIQHAGTNKTTTLAATLSDDMVKMFNAERERQPTLLDINIYHNVAVTLNNQKRTTLQGKAHTKDSVKSKLAEFIHLLTPRKKSTRRSKGSK